MKFFTSDLHLGSDDVIVFDNRPFKSEKLFSHWIVRKYNKLLKRDDELYIIGDFIDCHLKDDKGVLKKLEIVKKINAKVILIIGNNEQRVIKYFFDDNFDDFRNYCIALGFLDVKLDDYVSINNEEFYLTHKPKNHSEKMLTLFGHSHKAMGIYKSFGFNIGCDLNNYLPYSENDIKLLLEKKTKYWDKDANLKLI